MSDPTFQFAFENEKLFKDALKDAQERVKDLRVPLRQVANDWYKSNRSIFSLQSKGGYQDLSTKPFVAWWDKERDSKGKPILYKGGYKEYKRKKFGFEYPILKRSGNLGRSVTDMNDSNTVLSIDKTFLVMGTRVDYGIYHQSDDARTKIPLRKFLFIGPEAQRYATSDQMGRLDRWTKILNNYVLKIEARNSK